MPSSFWVGRFDSADGFKNTVPMSVMPKLGQINSAIQDPVERYKAVMALPDLLRSKE